LAVVSTAAGQTARKASSPDEDANIQAYMNLLRTDVRTGKVDILSAVMQFTPDQAAAFWPIYQGYDKEMRGQGDERLAAIREYAKNYGQLTDAKADDLTAKFLALRAQREELLRKCYQQVKQKMGGLTAARFLQVENQLLLLIDLQIAAVLPIAE